MSKCHMVMVEDGDFRLTWECSACGESRKATAKFEKSKECPACHAVIVAWDGLYDDD